MNDKYIVDTLNRIFISKKKKKYFIHIEIPEVRAV